MTVKAWTFGGLQGGGEALDGRITINITDGDSAQGYSTGGFYSFSYDGASVLAEQIAAFPIIIKPDDNAGAGRWVQNDLSSALITVDKTQFTISKDAPDHSEGLVFYDKVCKTLALYNDEADVTLQIGQEMWIRVYNDSGSEILNGKVCYLSGVFDSVPTIDLANSNAAATSLATIGIATHSIGIDEYGYITSNGLVRDVATDTFTTGDRLYLSNVVDGALVTTPPDSPAYLIGIGQAVLINATTGTIQVNVNVGTNTGSVIKIFNGAVLEDTATTISSDGTDVTLTYQKNGGGDLSLFFNGSFTNFDSTTPVKTIDLNVGTDTAPVLNYVYILQLTLALTVSTTGFPTAQHVPVATVLVQSAPSVVTDGVYKLHAWTDHLTDTNDQGHVSHINHWIRHQPATWISGVDPTVSITVNAAAMDEVYFSALAGAILQLHEQTTPAFDTEVSSPIFVVNDPSVPYRRIQDLADLNVDSNGDTLRGNNTYYSIVIFGVASESEADSKIYCNLPSGIYGNDTDALNDLSGYSNFSIPVEFRGTGFLIARVILRYQTINAGTITEQEVVNLRGLHPPTSPL